MGLTNQPPDLLPGTLDLPILRTLVAGELHVYGLPNASKSCRGDVLQVGEFALSGVTAPAAERMVSAEWGYRTTIAARDSTR
jgi:hypothetical protein